MNNFYCRISNIPNYNTTQKYSIQNRLSLLLDPDSFEEIDRHVTSPFLEKKYPTDGVIAGFGTIEDRRVAIYAQDFAIYGGSLGKMHAQKICKIMDLAAKIGCPIIGIHDSGGARIQEGIHALAGYGEILQRNTRYSGIIPQIALVLGPCAGGAVYSPALADFILTTENISQLFITGPRVIKEVLGLDISKNQLGGALVHASKSGVVHFVSKTEEECFLQLKALLSFLPDNYLCEPPTIQTNENLNKEFFETLIPKECNRPYDVKKIILILVDEKNFLEIQDCFAQNIVIGLGRIGGFSVGIVANQPLVQAGALDINASCKAARFIQFCDCFNIPIISLVDTPGYLPGIEQEHNGIIRHGAKLLHAYAQATVPKITTIIRKAYGGAYIVMGSKHLGSDFNFAWPSAEIAVLGTTAAIAILHRKKLAATTNPKQQEKMKQHLTQEYATKFLNPFTAAEFGYIDTIIEPNTTRKHIISALKITKEKVETLPKKKHSNPPL